MANASIQKKKMTNAGNVQLPGTTTYYNRNNSNPSSASEASAVLGNVVSSAPGQYKASEAVQNAYGQLQNTLNNKPGQYQSNYQSTLDGLLDKIVNQKDFSYDFNADALYQNYKNQYMQQGKQAMLDTQAAASALTGGYGSSYATSAGSQAYQQYLTQLNDRIPELYNLALQKYQMDTDKLYNQYSAVGQQEDRSYGQHRDEVSDWKDDRNYGLNQYNTMYNQDYGAYRDQVSDYYNDRNFYASRQDSLWNQEQAQKEFAYRQLRDQVSDSQWQQSFDYNKSRDAVSDSQWQKNYDYNVGRDQVSDNQWQQSFNYQQERDKVADSQWAQEYALAKTKAAASANKSSKTSENYTDGKKLTSTIQNQIEMLDGDELDDYLGSLIEAGYSYTAITDYMAQAGKGIPEEATSVTNDKTIDYDSWKNRMNNLMEMNKIAQDGESTEIPEELRKRYEKMWILPYVK